MPDKCAFCDGVTALVDKRRATDIYLDLLWQVHLSRLTSFVSKFERHGFNGWTT